MPSPTMTKASQLGTLVKHSDHPRALPRGVWLGVNAVNAKGVAHGLRDEPMSPVTSAT